MYQRQPNSCQRVVLIVILILWVRTLSYYESRSQKLFLKTLCTSLPYLESPECSRLTKRPRIFVLLAVILYERVVH